MPRELRSPAIPAAFAQHLAQPSEDDPHLGDGWINVPSGLPSQA